MPRNRRTRRSQHFQLNSTPLIEQMEQRRAIQAPPPLSSIAATLGLGGAAAIVLLAAPPARATDDCQVDILGAEGGAHDSGIGSASASYSDSGGSASGEASGGDFSWSASVLGEGDAISAGAVAGLSGGTLESPVVQASGGAGGGGFSASADSDTDEYGRGTLAISGSCSGSFGGDSERAFTIFNESAYLLGSALGTGATPLGGSSANSGAASLADDAVATSAGGVAAVGHAHASVSAVQLATPGDNSSTTAYSLSDVATQMGSADSSAGIVLPGAQETPVFAGAAADVGVSTAGNPSGPAFETSATGVAGRSSTDIAAQSTADISGDGERDDSFGTIHIAAAGPVIPNAGGPGNLNFPEEFFPEDDVLAAGYLAGNLSDASGHGQFQMDSTFADLPANPAQVEGHFQFAPDSSAGPEGQSVGADLRAIAHRTDMEDRTTDTFSVKDQLDLTADLTGSKGGESTFDIGGSMQGVMSGDASGSLSLPAQANVSGAMDAQDFANGSWFQSEGGLSSANAAVAQLHSTSSMNASIHNFGSSSDQPYVTATGGTEATIPQGGSGGSSSSIYTYGPGTCDVFASGGGTQTSSANMSERGVYADSSSAQVTAETDDSSVGANGEVLASARKGVGEVSTPATISALPEERTDSTTSIIGTGNASFAPGDQGLTVSGFQLGGSLVGAPGSFINATVEIKVDTDNDGVGDESVASASFSATCVQGENGIEVDFSSSGFTVESEDDSSFMLFRAAGTDLSAENTIVTFHVDQTLYPIVGVEASAGADLYEEFAS